MMRYKVPKFLEREMRFFNVFTFKQLVLVGSAALILFILYYIVPKSLFIFLSLLVAVIVFSMVFVKIQGVPLTQLLIQVFGFLVSSKKYFWQKKETFTTVSRTITLKEKIDKKEEKGPLRISPGSRLNKLSSKIETGL